MNEFINKHEAYKMLKDKQATYMQVAVGEAFGTAARMIDQMKPADVQPVKHGKWVEHINHRYDYDREQGDLTAGISYTCSLCDKYGVKGWRFCPSCGARMGGDAE